MGADGITGLCGVSEGVPLSQVYGVGIVWDSAFMNEALLSLSQHTVLCVHNMQEISPPKIVKH